MFSFIAFIFNKCLFSIIYIHTISYCYILWRYICFWKLLLGNDIFVLHKMINSSKFMLKIDYMKLNFRGLSHVGPRSVIDWSLGPIFWTLLAMLDPLYPILTFWPILNQGNIQSYPADQFKTNLSIPILTYWSILNQGNIQSYPTDQFKTNLSNPNLLTNLKPR